LVTRQDIPTVLYSRLLPECRYKLQSSLVFVLIVCCCLDIIVSRCFLEAFICYPVLQAQYYRINQQYTRITWSHKSICYQVMKIHVI